GVVAADSHMFGMCQWSRLSNGFERYRSHYLDEIGFVQDVSRICESWGVQILFPSHNETEVLSKHRSLLPVGVDVLLPPYEHCRLLNNKRETYDLAESLGISVPKRVIYENPNKVAQLITEAGMRR